MNVELIAAVYGPEAGKAAHAISNLDNLAAEFRGIGVFLEGLQFSHELPEECHDLMQQKIGKLSELREQMVQVQEHIREVPKIPPASFYVNEERTAIQMKVNFPEEPETFILYKLAGSVSVTRGDIEGELWENPRTREFGEVVNFADISAKLNHKEFLGVLPTQKKGPFRASLMNERGVLIIKIVAPDGSPFFFDIYKLDDCFDSKADETKFTPVPAYC